MVSKNYECEILLWDTNYFGIDSARVNLNGNLSEKEQEEVINFCENHEFVTIFNSDNLYKNNHWIGNKTDAYLTDINIHFEKKLNCEDNYLNDNTSIVNKLCSNDQIVEIAKNSFNFSRFFNDYKLPKKQTKNIYVHWTKTAFNQNDKYFAIWEKDEIIAGYILFSLNEKAGIIELIAVDNRFQGQGVGKTLMKTVESFVINHGIYKINVGTQLDNVPAIKFYTLNGYKMKKSNSVYHLWL